MPRSDELLQHIKASIQKADLKDTFSKKGEILELRDGVATVVGLDNAMFSEIVEFENKTKGLILDLSYDKVGVLILGESESLKQGDKVKTLWVVLSIPVGDEYLGRVVDGIWNPIDWGPEIKSKERGLVEKIAPGVMTRETVNIPLETWIKSIDAMVPIGRGQRELIIGDRQIGKTTIALDTILNQKDKNLISVYVAIGQKDAKVKQFVETLKERDAMNNTIIVNAPSSTAPVTQYLAPYIGCTLAEYFMNQGRDVLIIYDDLSKHAVAYREISLLLRRPPGREAYPGDIFYLHSRLLERAANLNVDYGWGSMTALPIVETLDSDISAYIPTNIISITDGQIFLETELFNAGNKPAVDVGLSVSRVGGNAQTKIMKRVAGKLRIQLATFRELANFMQFGSDLDAETYMQIEKGKRLTEMLKQKNNAPIPYYKQVILIYAGVNNYLNALPLEKIWIFESTLYTKLDTSYTKLTEMIQLEQDLTKDIEKQMIKVINETLKELIGNQDTFTWEEW